MSHPHLSASPAGPALPPLVSAYVQAGPNSFDLKGCCPLSAGPIAGIVNDQRHDYWGESRAIRGNGQSADIIGRKDDMHVVKIVAHYGHFIDGKHRWAARQNEGLGPISAGNSGPSTSFRPTAIRRFSHHSSKSVRNLKNPHRLATIPHPLGLPTSADENYGPGRSPEDFYGAHATIYTSYKPLKRLRVPPQADAA